MTLSRPYMISLAGLAILAAAIGLSIWNRHAEQVGEVESLTAPQPPAPSAAVETMTVPAFDIVRINTQGETVIAGRAMPKAEVVILDGKHELGRVIADNRGEWVFVPDQPLPPGSRELKLRASNPDGSIADSESPVVLVVPERGKGATLAVKVNPDGSLNLLQGPDAKADAGKVTVAAIRVVDGKSLAISGKAEAGASVRVYLDNAPIGTAKADENGLWSVKSKTNVRGGSHTLRADQIGPDGRTVARAEITFVPGTAVPPDGRVVVENGASLWKIARRAYGTGLDYTAIYEANKAQIRDPNLIYPGQVLSIPTNR